MRKTFSPTTTRQAVSGGDGVCRQIGRVDASILSSHSATSSARGAILALWPVRGSLDVGSGPDSGNRVGAVAAAARRCTRRNARRSEAAVQSSCGRI